MKYLRIILLLCLGAVMGCSKNGNIWLDAPKNVLVTNLTENSITVRWDAVEKATCYMFKYNPIDSLSGGGGLRRVNEVTISNLAPGTAYHFGVFSRDENTRMPDGTALDSYMVGFDFTPCPSWC